MTDYEENKHFFLSQYFRNHYDGWMQKLPNLTTGITINRVEVWVTNKTGSSENTRNIVALTDLGENEKVSNPMWTVGGTVVPANKANTEYDAMVNQYSAARDANQTSSTLEGAGLVGGNDLKVGECASSEFIGIYGEYSDGLYFLAKPVADRPGSGSGIRIYVWWCHLPGG